MASIMGTILRQATRKEGERLNILTFPTHERYESGLCKTGHNFYAYRGDNIKDWNKGYAPLPNNYTLLVPGKEPPLEVDFDIILSQNKAGQFPVALYFSKIFHCPMISLEHTLPVSGWTNETIEQFSKMSGDVNVFISEYSVGKWGFDREKSAVVHHGVDTNLFSINNSVQRKPHVLSVVNDWINRDWCCGFRLWQEAMKDMPVKVLGDTPGLSQRATSVSHLVQSYQEATVFLNTSLVSPVPTALLEAMACGCAVVSTATCMIPEIITNGVNGFLSNHPEEIREHCTALLRNPRLAARLGAAARKTILSRFSMEKFVENWNKILYYTADNVFVKE